MIMHALLIFFRGFNAFQDTSNFSMPVFPGEEGSIFILIILSDCLGPLKGNQYNGLSPFAVLVSVPMVPNRLALAQYSSLSNG